MSAASGIMLNKLTGLSGTTGSISLARTISHNAYLRRAPIRLRRTCWTAMTSTAARLAVNVDRANHPKRLSATLIWNDLI
ncbi:hypothetical protein VQ056_09710 [Paenibacillus sp. JTLBN-2024]